MPLIPIALALAQFVPDIVKWITGSDKAEDIASKVVDIAKQVTGKDDPQEAADAISANPQLAMQFQIAVMANRVELQKLYFEDIKDQRAKEIEDIKSARERDIGFLKAGQTNLRANIMLGFDYAGLITISLFFAASYYLHIDPGGAIAAFLCTIGGALLKNIGDAHQFEFGTSRGSQTKTITPADLVEVAKIGVRNGQGG